LAGLLAEGEGEEKRARKFFAQVAEGRPNSYTAAVLWRLGWMSYRAEQFDVAIDYFDRLVVEESSPESVRARYWRARAQERSGIAGFEAEYEAIARQAPLSYYGFRAARRVRTTEGASRNPIPRGSAAIGERDLARPRILLEAGLVVEALAELDRLFSRARGLADRLVLAQLYAEAGNFNRPQRLMVDAYGARLAGMPAPEDLDVWWHAWPIPFTNPFREVAARGVRVEPGLVYAVMREESGYRPEALSVVGARGLLQIMPETGDRLARREALSSFAHDDLFVPQINIRLGSSYLAQFMERFEGRTSAVIASYNAGPEAVSRWIEEGPVSDDEWVEAIPYDQTRGYVKRVLRSLHVYRVLY
jgi:soluble lytic murein transglycosylase